MGSSYGSWTEGRREKGVKLRFKLGGRCNSLEFVFFSVTCTAHISCQFLGSQGIPQYSFDGLVLCYLRVI